MNQRSSSVTPARVLAIGVYITIAVIALGVGSSGCVGGMLDPEVEPTAAALDEATCEVLPIFLQGAQVGEACSPVAGTVNGLLTAFSAPASVDAGLPMAMARTGVVGPLVPLELDGHVVGHLRGDLAQFVQSKLVSPRRCAEVAPWRGETVRR